jgi:hypothetical protein
MFFSLQTIDCEKFSKYYSVFILIKIELVFLIKISGLPNRKFSN